jgi:hypothetical protein
MAMLNTVTSAVTKYMPKMISPKAHELADYVLTASFLVTGALFLGKNRRASIAAFLCGGAGLTLSLLTDYSGAGRKAVSFPFHGKVELGIAAMTAAMPEFMGFEDNRERTAFFVQSGAITAVNNLTDFDRGSEFRSARRRMARTA